MHTHGETTINNHQGELWEGGIGKDMAHPYAQDSLGIQQQTGFLKRQYKRLGESQTGKPDLCAWGDHGADPHESKCKSYLGHGGDSEQPARLLPGEGMSEQSGGLQVWSD